MALGKKHDFVNLLALPFCLYYTPKEFYLPFTAGYLLGTFLLSPDLDLPQSHPSRRWKTLRFIWRPYQLLSRHRGVSHVPVLGTFLRLGYLIVLFVFLYFVLLGISRQYAPQLTELLLALDPFELLGYFAQREEVFYFALGVVASEVFHVALDVFDSFFAKRRRRKTRGKKYNLFSGG
ncbi:MAG: DUF2227 family putative metal-binding protein [Aquificaceae bacterium]|nr:DUF2227 family putative metal-binding protein [Aquificaceae bacterium]MCX8059892.1 DUF2227 family putative metal-binding protein [Aquificaceae bacterium]MDW8096912.1 DUF2227 family putative metal-binding protein [Aquificaceae bacterium]